MIEFLRSFFRTAEDRLNHPIVGAVVVSWTIWNWKAIAYFALSNTEVYSRINFIRDTYSSPFYIDVFAPILIALIYVSILPYVSQGVEYLTARAVRAGIESEKEKKRLREAVNENLTVANLSAKVSALEAENMATLAINTDLQNEITTQLNKNTTSSERIADLERQLEAVETERDEQVLELSTQLQDEKAAHLETVNDYKQRIENLVRSENEIREHLESKLLSTNEEMKQLKSQIMNITTTYNDDIKAKNSQIATLTNQLSEQSNAYSTAVQNYESKIEDLETREIELKTSNEKTVDQQQKIINETLQRVSELELDTKSIADDKNETIQERDKTIIELKEIISSLIEDISMLKNQAVAAEKKHQQEIFQLGVNHDSAIWQHQHEFEDLQRDADKKYSEHLSTLTSLKSSLYSEIFTLERELVDLEPDAHQKEVSERILTIQGTLSPLQVYHHRIDEIIERLEKKQQK